MRPACRLRRTDLQAFIRGRAALIALAECQLAETQNFITGIKNEIFGNLGLNQTKFSLNSGNPECHFSHFGIISAV